MRLPDTLCDAMRPHMNHSGWHIARLREQWLPIGERPDWRIARNEYPNVKYLDEPGSGREFLVFHRNMIRSYKWFLTQPSAAQVVYQPWREIPDWLAARFHPGAMGATYARILHLIRYGTADQLGSYLERNELDTSPGCNMHNLAHGYIARHEAENFVNDPRLAGAGMTDLSTACFNEHFWGLHGWMDEIYAMWQRLHDEPVNQEALDPNLAHAGHHGGGAGGGTGGSGGNTGGGNHDHHLQPNNQPHCPPPARPQENPLVEIGTAVLNALAGKKPAKDSSGGKTGGTTNPGPAAGGSNGGAGGMGPHDPHNH